MPVDASTAEQTLFNWLALRDPLPASPAHVVIGFGHFDLAIPRQCAELVRRGAALRIIFTGGIGAGTADLGQPEADAFAAELAKKHADLARKALIENRSTNTGDNIRFTRELLQSLDPPLPFGKAIRSVLLVATPCRQRRVWLTWQKVVPEVTAWNVPPPTTYDSLRSLYATKGEDIRVQLVGEYERIRDYPARGWIAEDQIPPKIHEAARILAEAQ
jgi:uncharacterized SAM-binding protein YcdF (DUF218 family)